MTFSCFAPSRRSSLTACLILACSGAMIASTSTDALAQPSPFDAYEGKKQVEQTRQVNNAGAVNTTPAPQVGACQCEGNRDTLAMPTARGQKFFDVRTALSATFSSNETEGDAVVRNSTLFARVSPGFGFFLRDNLELGGAAGIMWRRIARDQDDFSTSRDFLFEARARYHYGLTPRFALIPGMSLGAYIGRSERQVSVTQNGMPTTVDETTRTAGGAATLSLDAGYLVKQNVSINAGVGVIGLLGTERVGSLEEGFRVTTLNSSLNLGVAYSF